MNYTGKKTLTVLDLQSVTIQIVSFEPKKWV